MIRKTRTTVFPSGSCSLKTRKEKEPQYRGVPSVVAQYHKSRDALYEGQFDDKMKNLQRGGEGIIAVSYEARARGIKRGETRYLRDAKKICPEVHAFVVEEKYGKACLNLYRDASRRGTGVISIRGHTIYNSFVSTSENSSFYGPFESHKYNETVLSNNGKKFD